MDNAKETMQCVSRDEWEYKHNNRAWSAHCAVLSTTRCLQCAAGGRGKCAQEVGWPKIGAWRRPRPRRNSRCVRTQDTGQRTDNIFRAACEHCSVFTFLRLQSARCYTTGKGSKCAGFEVCGQGIPWTLDSDRWLVDTLHTDSSRLFSDLWSLIRGHKLIVATHRAVVPSTESWRHEQWRQGLGRRGDVDL